MRPLYFIIVMTTLAMVIYVGLIQFSGYLPILFSTFLVCQVLLAHMAYRILVDKQGARKSSNCWYEDKDMPL
ncbi:hypothetical protein [Roseivirga thermotolerans]|uniref:Uncharacterized protein n=1 Tax=Roseivirga thermotolerans TaxID=1758176 RepID=A0ABQ3IBB1_9BACT|nr:hypothetical protein [Roseivirga thermotolerans]GHE71209.1 hypothetical protein GCM10011340_28890 [Roseivirga thermotolerans]